MEPVEEPNYHSVEPGPTIPEHRIIASWNACKITNNVYPPPDMVDAMDAHYYAIKLLIAEKGSDYTPFLETLCKSLEMENEEELTEAAAAILQHEQAAIAADPGVWRLLRNSIGLARQANADHSAFANHPILGRTFSKATKPAQMPHNWSVVARLTIAADRLTLLIRDDGLFLASKWASTWVAIKREVESWRSGDVVETIRRLRWNEAWILIRPATSQPLHKPYAAPLTPQNCTYRPSECPSRDPPHSPLAPGRTRLLVLS
jgi:hypothetical protein